MNIHQEKLLELLKNEKCIAMLAPSFPIDFQYPNIIYALKKIGFNKVTELTYGAKIVNQCYKEYFAKYPHQKMYIATPCPTTTMLVEKKYPNLAPYLIKIDSPLGVMAKVINKYFPDHKKIFFSPCIAKRSIEGPKLSQYLDLIITFKELQEIFIKQKIDSNSFNWQLASFDSFYNENTKIYPIAGGLSKTAHIQKLFKPEEICITDGPLENKKILDQLDQEETKYKFIDILNCPGGCIGGNGFTNQTLSLEEKKKKIINYFKHIQSHCIINKNQEIEKKMNRSLDFFKKEIEIIKNK